MRACPAPHRTAGNLTYWIYLANGTLTKGFVPVQNIFMLPQGEGVADQGGGGWLGHDPGLL